MHLKNFKISWIKNKQIKRNLQEFIGNIIEKKGQDIIGILLFGSLAQGKAVYSPDYQSDIDLLIASLNLPSDIFSRKLYTAKLSKTYGCGIHQLWYTPAELTTEVNSHRAFFMEIIKYGIILFELETFFSNLKDTIDVIIREKGIIESEHVWIWPQEIPGSKIEW
jgi:predicted nucleotidyltransferase